MLFIRVLIRVSLVFSMLDFADALHSLNLRRPVLHWGWDGFG